MLYKKSETQTSIIIQNRFWPFFIYGTVIWLVTVALARFVPVLTMVGYVVVAIIIVGGACSLVCGGKYRAEIRKALAEGKAKVYGSKFSFSNPPTIEIKK